VPCACPAPLASRPPPPPCPQVSILTNLKKLRLADPTCASLSALAGLRELRIISDDFDVRPTYLHALTLLEALYVCNPPAPTLATCAATSPTSCSSPTSASRRTRTSPPPPELAALTCLLNFAWQDGHGRRTSSHASLPPAPWLHGLCKLRAPAPLLVINLPALLKAAPRLAFLGVGAGVWTSDPAAVSAEDAATTTLLLQLPDVCWRPNRLVVECNANVSCAA
jgi:hypothetical protein